MLLFHTPTTPAKLKKEIHNKQVVLEVKTIKFVLNSEVFDALGKPGLCVDNNSTTPIGKMTEDVYLTLRQNDSIFYTKIINQQSQSNNIWQEEIYNFSVSQSNFKSEIQSSHSLQIECWNYNQNFKTEDDLLGIGEIIFSEEQLFGNINTKQYMWANIFKKSPSMLFVPQNLTKDTLNSPRRIQGVNIADVLFEITAKQYTDFFKNQEIYLLSPSLSQSAVQIKSLNLNNIQTDDQYNITDDLLRKNQICLSPVVKEATRVLLKSEIMNQKANTQQQDLSITAKPHHQHKNSSLIIPQKQSSQSKDNNKLNNSVVTQNLNQLFNQKEILTASQTTNHKQLSSQDHIQNQVQQFPSNSQQIHNMYKQKIGIQRNISDINVKQSKFKTNLHQRTFTPIKVLNQTQITMPQCKLQNIVQQQVQQQKVQTLTDRTKTPLLNKQEIQKQIPFYSIQQQQSSLQNSSQLTTHSQQQSSSITSQQRQVIVQKQVLPIQRGQQQYLVKQNFIQVPNQYQLQPMSQNQGSKQFINFNQSHIQIQRQ